MLYGLELLSLMIICARLNDVVEEAGDSKRTDAAGGWCDGGEVGTFADFCGEIAF